MTAPESTAEPAPEDVPPEAPERQLPWGYLIAGACVVIVFLIGFTVVRRK